MFASNSTAEITRRPGVALCLAACLSLCLQPRAHAQDAGVTPDAAADEPPAEDRDAPGAGTPTRPPAVLRDHAPALPPDAPPLAEAGEVILELTIDAEGRPDNVRVVAGLDPVRDAAAARALSAFSFSPAEIDGAPAAVVIEYRFAFAATTTTTTAAAEARPVTVAPPPPTTGTLAGLVLQRGTRRPIVGAGVALPELGIDTLTDADGRFSFSRVPVGTHTVRVEDPDHAALHAEEEIRAHTRTELRYYIEPLRVGRADVVATGQRVRREVSHHAIDVETVTTAPGTQGDAIKVIQNLPGVARIPFGDGGIVLRGGGFSETFIDGHFVPNVFHFGGLRSIVGNGLLEAVHLSPGNYGARYGNANAGIVDITLRAPDHEGVHGFGQVDLFDASLFLEGPISEHTSLGIGGRRSYIDALLPAIVDGEDADSISVAPVYYDYQLMVDHDTGRDDLRFQVVGGYDRMVLLQEDPATDDPAVRGAFNLYEQWVTSQAHWRHRFGADTDNALSVGYLVGDADNRVGDRLRLKFTYHTWTLRNDLRHRFSPTLQLRAGPDLRLSRVAFDVTAPKPPKEGAPETPLSVQPTLQAEGVMWLPQPAAWAELDWQLGPLRVVPGLRAEHFSRAGALSGDTLVHPRLSTRLDVGGGATLKGAVGSYSRTVEIDERHERFGNPDLSPQQSVHYALGAEQRLFDRLLLDATAFYKHLFDQVVSVDDPALRYDNAGRGRAYGLELLAKWGGPRLRAQVAYTLMRSERAAGPDAPHRLFELDQTHNLNVLAQYRLFRTWELGARFRYVTGNPETPYTGAIYDSDADAYVPVPGAPLSTRQPAFHQLDVRVDKHFVFDTWRLTAYLDVQNAYDRENPEATTHNYDYTQSGTVAGLPVIPSVGVKGAF